MESIYIKEININKCNIDVYFSVSDKLKKYFDLNQHFFTEYSFDVSDIPKSIAVIPVLLNLLQFSWLSNSILWVNEIDEDFYNNIFVLKNAFKEMYPDINIGGSLIAAKIIKNRVSKKDKVLQLFTGGIDATTTLIRHIDEKPILFNTNGWYKNNASEKNSVYDADLSAINGIAESFDLESCFVKSNFGNFINASKINNDFLKKQNTTWWFGFQHSMAFLGCAMVAAFKYGADKVYIASSYTFGQYILCVSDPRIDNCVKCANINTYHDGYELSRQDKVKLLTDFHNSYKKDITLRVCSFNESNCCKCEKCLRSMLSLIAEGADDLSEYGFYFENDFLDILKNFIYNNAMELDKNHIVFWNDIIDKMKKNYDILKHKEVYEFLTNLDLNTVSKKARLNYYKNNFFKILKRKIFKK